MHPPITVVLPFYNAAPTLSACLDSILNQTLSDFELLALDDGSDDASTDIVAAYASRDPRIRLLRCEHLGIVGIANLGLTEAQGEWIARMDADDLMAPERLEQQAAFLRDHPEVGVVGSRVVLFADDGEVQGGFAAYGAWQNQLLTPAQMAGHIYFEAPLANPTAMMRKDVVIAAGGYQSGDFPEDYELWLRLHERGVGLGKVDEVLLHWRDSGGRLTRTDSRYSRAAFDRVRHDYLLRDPRLRMGRDLVFWGAGQRTRRRIRPLIGSGLTPSAWIEVDPAKIGSRYQGAPVHPPEWLEHLEGRAERPFVLALVTNHGAVEAIGGYLEDQGYRLGIDWLPVG